MLALWICVVIGILVGGTVSQRVHVNVDYDQTREFDAANNINVYYQGFEDEILQRLDEKEKESSKKGAFYYVFDKKKYKQLESEGIKMI